ncbi:MAG: type III polyketide synthase [Rhodothermales bacterium]|nr:type III polyketide synthase [Rhodothermales bacterium]MBO6780943.1 type III polyketide synthase [Rhodothermales bacterium]
MAFIHSIATRVPRHAYPQEEVGQVLRAALEPGGRGDRLSQKIYRSSGIETRHSVISGYKPGTGDGLFFDTDTGRFMSPTTGQRNDLYVAEAKPLFVETARVALEASGFAPEEITHVVTASCTGFFAPGPDYYILRDLGLPPSTQRYHVGFMGCFAAFPSLRMAASFCANDPNAVVLVVCLELCTLHLEPSEVVDNIIASAVFADGAAGVVVSSQPPAGVALDGALAGPHRCESGLELTASSTRLAPNSEDDMAWNIGDHGFDMVLSTYVPRVLGTEIGGVVDDILGDAGRGREDVVHWWVHPGGRAIIDHVQEALALEDISLEPSRDVLARYGNMSSATILFVIQEALRRGDMRTGELAYAMAFGPGLTVESALFRGV